MNPIATPITQDLEMPFTTAATAKVAASTPGIGAALAGVVVMLLAYPKSRREFTAAMVSTLATSIFGGAALIEYLAITEWSHVAQGGAYFLCGLPAWVIVRGFFAWSERNKERDLVELVKQIRDAWSGNR